MKATLKIFLTVLLIGGYEILQSQTNSVISTDILKPDPRKETLFLPYLAVRHGGMPNIQQWKKENTMQYYRELWYYTESFSVKRDHVNTGIALDESIIDISRFESYRKENEEAIVLLPGFKDALILLPANKLIYKPSF